MSRSTSAHPRTRGGALSFVRMSWVLPACALLLLVVLVSLQFAPSIIEQRRDSGIFAYIGLTIRNGGLPYVDAWDNKLPGVYFINALAFLIFGASRWALWLAENLTIFAAGMALFWLLRQVYGDRSEAWVGPLVLVLLTRHPTLTSDINFTEPYALLPQVLVLAAGYQFLRRPRSWWGFAIGFAAGVAFLIKQTTIGGALMFIPAILISRHPVLGTRQRWHWLGTIVLGGVCSLGIVALYLLVHGILDDAIAASFVAANTFHEWVSEGSVWIGRTVITTWTASLAPLVDPATLALPGIGDASGLAWPASAPFRRPPGSDRHHLAGVGDAHLLRRYGAGQRDQPRLCALLHYHDPGHRPADDHEPARSSALHCYSTGRRRKIWAGLRVYLAVLLLGVPVVTTLVRVALSRTSLSGLERQQEVVSYVEERTDESDTVWCGGSTRWSISWPTGAALHSSTMAIPW